MKYCFGTCNLRHEERLQNSKWSLTDDGSTMLILNQSLHKTLQYMNQQLHWLVLGGLIHTKTVHYLCQFMFDILNMRSKVQPSDIGPYDLISLLLVMIVRQLLRGQPTLQPSTRVSRSAEPGVSSTANAIVPLQVNRSRLTSPVTMHFRW